MEEFEGRRALITGGTRGVGEAIVRRFAAAGARVATTARSPLPKDHAADFFVQADISTRDGVDNVVRQVLDRFGGLDILIHNAGGSAAPGGGSLALSDDDWQDAMDTNLFAAVRLDRGFLPSMLKQGSGVIIHIAQVSRQDVVERSIAHFRNADPDYGRRLTEALTPVAIGRAKA